MQEQLSEVLSSPWFWFLIVAVLAGAVTAGVKSVISADTRKTWLAPYMPLFPVVFGASLCAIPHLIPLGLPLSQMIALGGIAGSQSGWVYDFFSGFAKRRAQVFLKEIEATPIVPGTPPAPQGPPTPAHLQIPDPPDQPPSR